MFSVLFNSTNNRSSNSGMVTSEVFIDCRIGIILASQSKKKTISTDHLDKPNCLSITYNNVFIDYGLFSLNPIITFKLTNVRLQMPFELCQLVSGSLYLHHKNSPDEQG